MIHNFEHSLQHEREQATRADAFYREALHATDIKRFNSGSEDDMKMQRQDVDILLTIHETTYRISEKFRNKDFGDMYIEVYSKYPETPGWLFTGTPNAILYFTPKSVYWITHKSLSAFYTDMLFPLISESWYMDLFQSHKSILTKRINLKNESVKINLIQAHNAVSDGAHWETIGLSIPFGILQHYGVKIQVFDIASKS